MDKVNSIKIITKLVINVNMFLLVMILRIPGSKILIAKG